MTPEHDTVRRFITERYPQADIAGDDDIFALGYVNSLFAVELVRFVEKTFGITVPEDAMRMDNFRTIDAIVELVRGAAAVADR
ncbi:acyl carrier protein [Streptomyces sp. NPDC056405]|uniref:acyl carrier protein n=1 Tax=Streptomyces sp. NPDC056405 TaxID=3345811 RepID=UPI0035DBEF16